MNGSSPTWKVQEGKEENNSEYLLCYLHVSDTVLSSLLIYLIFVIDNELMFIYRSETRTERRFSNLSRTIQLGKCQAGLLAQPSGPWVLILNNHLCQQQHTLLGQTKKKENTDHEGRGPSSCILLQWGTGGALSKMCLGGIKSNPLSPHTMVLIPLGSTGWDSFMHFFWHCTAELLFTGFALGREKLDTHLGCL